MADFYSDHEWIFTYGGFKLLGLMLFLFFFAVMVLLVLIGRFMDSRFYKRVRGKK